jgi:cytochrome c peroxidase
MSSMRVAQMVMVLGSVGVGCVEDEPGSRSEGVVSAEAIVAPALRPPVPFVMAADGVTELSLEQAGILKPGGNAWARVMGKALFWDLQAGSDGNACASCHFHAGADARLRNQINPGFNDVTKGPGGDTAFGSVRSDLVGPGAVAPGRMPSGAEASANYLLTAADMPFHRLFDEGNRNSPIITTTNDRVSSLGAYDGAFTRMHGRVKAETCGAALLSVFRAGPFAARQVEPRNTPTFHNAAFSHRNFWDNRANNLFNGVGVFGLRDVVRDPNSRLVISVNGVPTLGHVEVENASTASQAVGPPLSALEMSCGGRSFPEIGRKLLTTIPLFQQQVSAQDSLLGPYVSPSGRGLRPQYRYDELIRKTFDPKYWSLSGRYRIVNGALVADPQGYTQMELNFSMFWGLSIAAYEATQVSDQTEFDILQAQGKLVMKTAFVPAGPAIGGCSAPLGGVDPLLVRG